MRYVAPRTAEIVDVSLITQNNVLFEKLERLLLTAFDKRSAKGAQSALAKQTGKYTDTTASATGTGTSTGSSQSSSLLQFADANTNKLQLQQRLMRSHFTTLATLIKGLRPVTEAGGSDLEKYVKALLRQFQTLMSHHSSREINQMRCVVLDELAEVAVKGLNGKRQESASAGNEDEYSQSSRGEGMSEIQSISGMSLLSGRSEGMAHYSHTRSNSGVEGASFLSYGSNRSKLTTFTATASQHSALTSISAALRFSFSSSSCSAEMLSARIVLRKDSVPRQYLLPLFSSLAVVPALAKTIAGLPYRKSLYTVHHSLNHALLILLRGESLPEASKPNSMTHVAAKAMLHLLFNPKAVQCGAEPLLIRMLRVPDIAASVPLKDVQTACLPLNNSYLSLSNRPALPRVLALLCGSREQPLRRNQEIILRALSQSHSFMQSISVKKEEGWGGLEMGEGDEGDEGFEFGSPTGSTGDLSSANSEGKGHVPSLAHTCLTLFDHIRGEIWSFTGTGIEPDEEGLGDPDGHFNEGYNNVQNEYGSASASSENNSKNASNQHSQIPTSAVVSPLSSSSSSLSSNSTALARQSQLQSTHLVHKFTLDSEREDPSQYLHAGEAALSLFCSYDRNFSDPALDACSGETAFAYLLACIDLMSALCYGEHQEGRLFARRLLPISTLAAFLAPPLVSSLPLPLVMSLWHAVTAVHLSFPFTHLSRPSEILSVISLTSTAIRSQAIASAAVCAILGLGNVPPAVVRVTEGPKMRSGKNNKLGGASVANGNNSNGADNSQSGIVGYDTDDEKFSAPRQRKTDYLVNNNSSLSASSSHLSESGSIQEGEGKTANIIYSHRHLFQPFFDVLSLVPQDNTHIHHTSPLVSLPTASASSSSARTRANSKRFPVFYPLIDDTSSSSGSSSDSSHSYSRSNSSSKKIQRRTKKRNNTNCCGKPQYTPEEECERDWLLIGADEEYFQDRIPPLSIPSEDAFFDPDYQRNSELSSASASSSRNTTGDSKSQRKAANPVVIESMRDSLRILSLLMFECFTPALSAALRLIESHLRQSIPLSTITGCLKRVNSFSASSTSSASASSSSPNAQNIQRNIPQAKHSSSAYLIIPSSEITDQTNPSCPIVNSSFTLSAFTVRAAQPLSIFLRCNPPRDIDGNLPYPLQNYSDWRLKANRSLCDVPETKIIKKNKGDSKSKAKQEKEASNEKPAEAQVDKLIETKMKIFVTDREEDLYRDYAAVDDSTEALGKADEWGEAFGAMFADLRGEQLEEGVRRFGKMLAIQPPPMANGQEEFLEMLAHSPHNVASLTANTAAALTSFPTFDLPPVPLALRRGHTAFSIISEAERSTTTRAALHLAAIIHIPLLCLADLNAYAARLTMSLNPYSPALPRYDIIDAQNPNVLHSYNSVSGNKSEHASTEGEHSAVHSLLYCSDEEADLAWDAVALPYLNHIPRSLPPSFGRLKTLVVDRNALAIQGDSQSSAFSSLSPSVGSRSSMVLSVVSAATTKRFSSYSYSSLDTSLSLFFSSQSSFLLQSVLVPHTQNRVNMANDLMLDCRESMKLRRTMCFGVDNRLRNFLDAIGIPPTADAANEKAESSAQSSFSSTALVSSSNSKTLRKAEFAKPKKGKDKALPAPLPTSSDKWLEMKESERTQLLDDFSTLLSVGVTIEQIGPQLSMQRQMEDENGTFGGASGNPEDSRSGTPAAVSAISGCQPSTSYEDGQQPQVELPQGLLFVPNVTRPQMEEPDEVVEAVDDQDDDMRVLYSPHEDDPEHLPEDNLRTEYHMKLYNALPKQKPNAYRTNELLSVARNELLMKWSMFSSTIQSSLSSRIESESSQFLEELKVASRNPVKLRRLIVQLPVFVLPNNERLVVFLLRAFTNVVESTKGAENRAKLRQKMTRDGCLKGCMLQIASPNMVVACTALTTVLTLLGIKDIGVAEEVVEDESDADKAEKERLKKMKSTKYKKSVRIKPEDEVLFADEGVVDEDESLQLQTDADGEEQANDLESDSEDDVDADVKIRSTSAKEGENGNNGSTMQKGKRSIDSTKNSSNDENKPKDEEKKSGSLFERKRKVNTDFINQVNFEVVHASLSLILHFLRGADWLFLPRLTHSIDQITDKVQKSLLLGNENSWTLNEMLTLENGSKAGHSTSSDAIVDFNEEEANYSARNSISEDSNQQKEQFTERTFIDLSMKFISSLLSNHSRIAQNIFGGFYDAASDSSVGSSEDRASNLNNSRSSSGARPLKGAAACATRLYDAQLRLISMGYYRYLEGKSYNEWVDEDSSEASGDADGLSEASQLSAPIITSLSTPLNLQPMKASPLALVALSPIARAPVHPPHEQKFDLISSLIRHLGVLLPPSRGTQNWVRRMDTARVHISLHTLLLLITGPSISNQLHATECGVLPILNRLFSLSFSFTAPMTTYVSSELIPKSSSTNLLSIKGFLSSAGNLGKATFSKVTSLFSRKSKEELEKEAQAQEEAAALNSQQMTPQAKEDMMLHSHYKLLQSEGIGSLTAMFSPLSAIPLPLSQLDENLQSVLTLASYQTVGEKEFSLFNDAAYLTLALLEGPQRTTQAVAFENAQLGQQIHKTIHTLHCLHTLSLRHPVLSNQSEVAREQSLKTGMQLMKVAAYISAATTKSKVIETEMLEYKTTCPLFSKKLCRVEVVRVYQSDTDDGENYIKESYEEFFNPTHISRGSYKKPSSLASPSPMASSSAESASSVAAKKDAPTGIPLVNGGGAIDDAEQSDKGSVELVFFEKPSLAEEASKAELKQVIDVSWDQEEHTQRLNVLHSKSIGLYQNLAFAHTLNNMKYTKLILNKTLGMLARILSAFVILVINLLLLMLDIDEIPISIRDYLIPILVRILGIVQLVLCAYSSVRFFLMNNLVVFFERMRNYRIAQQCKDRKWELRKQPWYKKVYVAIRCTLSGSLAYVVFQLVITVLGFAVEPYFFCFLVIDFVKDMPILRFMIKAIANNASILSMVGIVILIVIGIFSHFVVGFLPNRMLDEDGGNICESYGTCFLSLLWAVPAGGAEVVGWLLVTSTIDAIFLFLFWAMVPIILMNVFLAIIVDALGDMRSARAATEETKKGMCLICGLSRHDLDKMATGFEVHVHHEHNPNDYIYFFISLLEAKAKDIHAEDKISGTESLQLAYITTEEHPMATKIFPVGQSFSVIRTMREQTKNELIRQQHSKDAKDTTAAAITAESAMRIRNAVVAMSAVKEMQIKLNTLENALQDARQKTQEASRELSSLTSLAQQRSSGLGVSCANGTYA